jgi:hypothetical protein
MQKNLTFDANIIVVIIYFSGFAMFFNVLIPKNPSFQKMFEVLLKNQLPLILIQSYSTFLKQMCFLHFVFYDLLKHEFIQTIK